GIRGIDFCVSDTRPKTNPWKGRKHKPESIELMRKAHLGNTNGSGKRSDETKAKFSTIKKANPPNFWLGKKRSQLTKNKIRLTKWSKRLDRFSGVLNGYQ
ncbi:MAG: hypothetical protein JSR57_12270, partial [Verrucomicrobia bacterium]|nr:hypothetical protein [Verrucomicrobiota bacterium]